MHIDYHAYQVACIIYGDVASVTSSEYLISGGWPNDIMAVILFTDIYTMHQTVAVDIEPVLIGLVPGGEMELGVVDVKRGAPV